jgi:hypothetical protein
MSVTVNFKHVNTGGAITLYTEQIFGFMELPAHKCIAAIGPGNATVPIAENLETALALVEQANRKDKTTNGSTTDTTPQRRHDQVPLSRAEKKQQRR